MTTPQTTPSSFIIYSATPTSPGPVDEICEQPLILILEKAETKGVFKYYISMLGGGGGLTTDAHLF